MVRILVSIAVFFAIQVHALADLRGFPARLDHALWPGQHNPKFVCAGEISSTEDRKFTFRVAGVIFGDGIGASTTIRVQNSLVWPEALVPYRKGEFCLLVLGRPKADSSADFCVAAVVPGRNRTYPRAADLIAARGVLLDELLAQLPNEPSAIRQRLLLLQVAPILTQEKSGAVVSFVTNNDASLRRSAIAALVYATEKQEFLEAAATDIHDFFDRTLKAKPVDGVDNLGRKVQYHPRSLLLQDYFFLEPRTWKWGSMWNEREAEKHLRIMNGITEFKVIDEAAKKWLLGE